MNFNDDLKRTWAEIDLEAIKSNYRAIRKAIPAGCRFLGVLKADAYGHGALKVAGLLQSEGADYFAVACIDEAIALRDAGITVPILILGHTPGEYTKALIDYNLTQTVTCLSKAQEYSAKAAEAGRVLKVHIKVDTGMSRLGFLCDGEYFPEGVKNILSACALPGLDPEGIYTHFAMSDEPTAEGKAYTDKQLSLFKRMVGALEENDLSFPIRHCANSGAVVDYPEACMDMVRPGLLLYGYGDAGNKLGLKPCMRLVTKISTIKIYDPGVRVSYGGHYVTSRKTRVAVLGIGYADGLFRSLSNKCSFSICGKAAPQIGNICMDMCMADITDIPEAAVDSEVEIFGTGNSILMLSEAAGTIPYELLCSVSKRVPRVYK